MPPSSGSATCGPLRLRRYSEAVLDRAPRPVERFPLPAKLTVKVCSEEKRVELERELRGIDVIAQMAFFLGDGDGLLQRTDPVMHVCGDGIAHETGTAIKLE